MVACYSELYEEEESSTSMVFDLVYKLNQLIYGIHGGKHMRLWLAIWLLEVGGSFWFIYKPTTSSLIRPFL